MKTTLLDGLAILAEQCEVSGRLDIAALLDNALGLLDPDSALLSSPPTAIVGTFMESYKNSLVTADSEEVDRIISSALSSLAESIRKLETTGEGLLKERSLKTAAKAQAVAVIIRTLLNGDPHV